MDNKLDYEQVKDKALTILQYRSLSEAELRRKLAQKGAEESDIDRVVEFLKEYKFINDEDYARRLAHDLVVLKKFGLYRIKRELASRGIDDEIIQLTIENMDIDEEQNLLPLVEKKLGGNFERKNIDKAIRYFLYRGYSFDDIRRCIDYAKQNGEDYGL